MANNISVKADITKTFPLSIWASNLKPNVIKLIQDTLKSALPVIQSKERVKTGNMRNNTTYSNSGTGGYITASAPYSGFQDLGTRYMTGTHFMEAGVSYVTSQLGSALPRVMAPK